MWLQALSLCFSTCLLAWKKVTLLRQHCAVTCLTGTIMKTNAFQSCIIITATPTHMVPTLTCTWKSKCNVISMENMIKKISKNKRCSVLCYPHSNHTVVSTRKLQFRTQKAWHFLMHYFFPPKFLMQFCHTNWNSMERLQLFHVVFSISSIDVSVTPISSWYNFFSSLDGRMCLNLSSTCQ